MSRLLYMYGNRFPFSQQIHLTLVPLHTERHCYCLFPANKRSPRLDEQPPFLPRQHLSDLSLKKPLRFLNYAQYHKSLRWSSAPYHWAPGNFPKTRRGQHDTFRKESLQEKQGYNGSVKNFFCAYSLLYLIFRLEQKRTSANTHNVEAIHCK